jgi:hypothetical protein
MPRAIAVSGWTLGFKQFSLHHANRALPGLRFIGFPTPRLSRHASFPLAFRLWVITPHEVGRVAQEHHAQLLPCCTGIKPHRNSRRTRVQPLTGRA